MIWLLAVLAFSYRALPRMLRKNAMPSDTYFHMFCAEAIRNNRFRIPRAIPRIVLCSRHTYPFLYHLLLAFFPIRLRVWAERLTPAFFDTLMLLLVYAFVKWTAEGNPSIPVLVALLFAFSPALLRISLGPRVYSGSPRVPAEFFYMLHILAFWIGFQSGNPLFWTISLLAGAALIITAKFANQVFFFFGLWFTLIITPWYALALLGSLALSVLLTGGRAIDVLTGQIRHSIFYYKYSQRIFLHPNTPKVRPYISNLRSAFAALRRGHKVLSTMRWFSMERFFLHQLVTVYPQFIFLAFVWPAAISSPVDRFLLVWSGAGLFWFFTTRIKSLMFLGEPDRYLEYALFPSLFLTVEYLVARNLAFIIYLFLLYSIVMVLFHLWLYLKTTDDNFETTNDLFTRLNGLEEGVIMPIGSFHWQTLYRSKFPVLTLANADERLMPPEEFYLVYGNYPYPSARFQEIIERYNVRYVISDKDHLAHYFNVILQEPERFTERTEKLFEAGSMLLFKVK
jgi:hypothetical protein